MLSGYGQCYFDMAIILRKCLDRSLICFGRLRVFVLAYLCLYIFYTEKNIYIDNIDLQTPKMSKPSKIMRFDSGTPKLAKDTDHNKLNTGDKPGLEMDQTGYIKYVYYSVKIIFFLKDIINAVYSSSIGVLVRSKKCQNVRILLHNSQFCHDLF